MALHKTSASSHRQTSLHMASFRLADTHRLVVLEALEALEAHIKTALVPRAAFLVALDRSQVDIPARLACHPLRLEPLLAGSRQVKASTSPLAHSHHTCRAVLVHLIRINHHQGQGVLLRQDRSLAKMRHPRLLKRTAHPRYQRRTKVRRRQELHQPLLLHRSKLLRPQLSRNQTLLLRSHRPTHSLRSSEEERRRVVKGVAVLSLLYPYRVPGPRRQCHRLRRRRNPHNLR